MKRCPKCKRVETDDALAFCRADGTALIKDSGLVNADAGTMKFGSAPVPSEIGTSIINKFMELAKTQYMPHSRIGSIYGALGERDKAFPELEKSFEDRDWDLFRLKVDPLFAPLRDDPRFKTMLKRLNLPE